MDTTADTFIGKDIFGRPVLAVRGKIGSVIVMRPGPDSDDATDESNQTVSLSADAAVKFAEWITHTQPEDRHE